MIHRRLQIPGGMQDTLPAECAAKKNIEKALRGLFEGRGYQEIETPILEYYDALNDDTWGYSPEHLWKTFDSDGRVLALRPDTTIPAARLAAGRLSQKELPLRISYIQSACKYERDTLSMLSEQTQAGVELMGVNGPQADAEVIALAVESLRSAGIRDFQIELGQAAFLDGLMEEAGLDAENIAVLRKLTEEKNTLGIQMLLRKMDVTEDVTRRLTKLPLLYGPLSKIQKARAMTASPACIRALDNLEEVIEILRMYGCADELTLDLGMTQEAGYYSGVVFRAQTAHVGQPILSGGRYDGLNARFGRSLPAVGFAMSLKLALIALERQGETFASPQIDYEIGFASAQIQSAIELAQQLRGQGKRSALAYDMTPEQLLERQKKGVCLHAIYLTEEGTVQEYE